MAVLRDDLLAFLCNLKEGMKTPRLAGDNQGRQG